MIGKVQLIIRLAHRIFEHNFFVLDDSKCRMHNVILENDFGEKAGLVVDLTDHQTYYKDTYLMSALDGGHVSAADGRRGDNAAEEREVHLPENDITAIDVRDEKEAVVNLSVRIEEPIRLPARTQMAVNPRFEPAVCEETVVLVEPTNDLLEKHGVCLAKGLVPLKPEECIGQLIMANTTDHDIWL